QDRALLVQLPPLTLTRVAGEQAHRQHPFIGTAERDERARGDHPGYFAVERPLPTGLEQLALEREAARDVVRVTLDLHRLALAFGAPRTEPGEPARSRRPPA